MSPGSFCRLRHARLIGLLCLYLAACSPSASHTPLPPSLVPSVTLNWVVELPDTPVVPGMGLMSTNQPPPTVAPTYTSVPRPDSTPTPLACRHTPGRMELNSLHSALAPQSMNYRVYLPPCYTQEARRRYPVLYMIHGLNFDESQWDRLGIDELADRLIAAGQVAPFLIVMPADHGWKEPAEDPFDEIFEKELIPRIDRNYRTLPERSQRAIGGLSRGAGWAVHIGLLRWDLFGAIGGHSLPVFWEDTTYLQRRLQAIPLEQRPRIFLDIGDRDRPNILQSAVWFEGLLQKEHYAHEWYLYPGYHEEAYWRAHLEQYLRWYTAEW